MAHRIWTHRLMNAAADHGGWDGCQPFFPPYLPLLWQLFIRYWKSSALRLLTNLHNVFTKPVGYLLRNEHNLVLFTAFGFMEDQLRSWMSPNLSFNTSPMRILPRAIDSIINLLRILVVLKMISSTVYLSRIFHLDTTLSRYSFRIMGVSHGLADSWSIFLRIKLKKADNWAYRIRLV